MRANELSPALILSRSWWVGDCLVWMMGTDNDGYGLIDVKRKKYRVHRLAFELFVGPIPPGMIVCHTCDNTRCVNVKHLYLGTHKDNIHDAISKGRMNWQWDPDFRKRRPTNLADQLEAKAEEGEK